MSAPRCPYSGREILSCKVSDLCDCFEFPEQEAEAVRIIEERDKRRCAVALTERRFDDMCDDHYDEMVGDDG